MFNVVERHQLASLGISDYSIRDAARCCLVFTGQGTFVVARPCGRHEFTRLFMDWPEVEDRWRKLQATPTDPGAPENYAATLHLAKIHAVSNRIRPDEVVSGYSAVIVHRYVPYRAAQDRVSITRPDKSRSSTQYVIRHHRHLDEADIVERDGIQVTSGPRSIIDLAREFSLETVALAANAYLDYRRGEPEAARTELLDALERTRARKYRRFARECIDQATGLSESVGEALCVIRLRALGFADFQQQVWFSMSDGRRYRVDFYFPSRNLIVEFDGWAKFHDAEGHLDENRLRNDRHREDVLRSTGARFARLEWSDLHHPTSMATKLRDAQKVGYRIGR